MLHHGDHPAGHETSGPDGRAAPGQLAHLDLAAPGDYLDSPSGAGSYHVIGLRHVAGVDHDLDAIALHVRLRLCSGAAGARWGAIAVYYPDANAVTPGLLQDHGRDPGLLVLARRNMAGLPRSPFGQDSMPEAMSTTG